MKLFPGACLCIFLLTVTAVTAQPGPTADKPYPWARQFGRCAEPGAAERIGGCKPPPDWPDLDRSIQNVGLLFTNLNGEYELITRAENDLAFSNKRFDTGGYYADAWYWGLERQVGDGGNSGKKFVETWRAHLGNDGTAPLAEAIVHYGDAWTARGGGLARTVSPEAWGLYYAALDRALDAIDQGSARLKNTAPYHDLRLRVLLLMRDKREAALDEFRQTIARWPDYRRIYASAGKAALPEWGGDFHLLDGVARSALDHNTPDTGAEIYTYVYLLLITLSDRYTLSDTEVDWPLMKRGIKVFTDRPWTNLQTLEALAKSACQMQDREEARRIYSIIDQRAKPTDERPRVTDACRVYATAQ